MNSLENAQKANFTEVEETKETFNLNELEATALEESKLQELKGGIVFFWCAYGRG